MSYQHHLMERAWDLVLDVANERRTSEELRYQARRLVNEASRARGGVASYPDEKPEVKEP